MSDYITDLRIPAEAPKCEVCNASKAIAKIIIDGMNADVDIYVCKEVIKELQKDLKKFKF